MFYDRYYLTVFNGLNEIARDEIKHKLPEAVVETIFKGRENSLLLIKYPYEPQELGQLRISEDIFYLLDVVPLTRRKEDLSILKERLLQNKYLERGLRVHRLFRQKIHRGKTSYRVVAQANSTYAYRRVDSQIAVEKAIAKRYNYQWKLVDDHADIEFWIHLIDNQAIIGIRLSTASMRLRDYKKAHIPASLRATIAAALVWLSEIETSDIFLDPMCGAGTILIERAQAGPYAQLLGGDKNPLAITASLENIGKKYQPISLQQWDATKLPLKDHSVNKICSNLPFGKQIGSHSTNKSLYREFLVEAERVLMPHGRLVILTSSTQLLEKCLAGTPQFQCVTMYRNIDVLGQRATIYVIEKK